MAFIVVMTMALVTAIVLVPCATTLIVKSAGSGLRSRKTRQAATDARVRAVFGAYGISTSETVSPVKTIRPVRPPVMQYANSVPCRRAG